MSSTNKVNFKRHARKKKLERIALQPHSSRFAQTAKQALATHNAHAPPNWHAQGKHNGAHARSGPIAIGVPGAEGWVVGDAERYTNRASGDRKNKPERIERYCCTPRVLVYYSINPNPNP